MKKSAIVLAMMAALAAASQAHSVGYEVNGINTNVDVDASAGEVTITYDPAGSPFTGDWNFDFNGDTVDFSGNIYLGDYDAHTDVDASFLGSMEGTVSYVGANHTISGTGNWDASTNTLSYALPTGGANSNIASSYSETSSSCTDSGSIGGQTVCGAWSQSTPEWEGLSLDLVFSGDLQTFSGTMTAVERSGSGLTANTTTLEFDVDGEVPLPAAAWLFGTGLVGLAGIARRRNQKAA